MHAGLVLLIYYVFKKNFGNLIGFTQSRCLLLLLHRKFELELLPEKKLPDSEDGTGGK